MSPRAALLDKEVVMTANEVHSNAIATNIDMKLEIVVIPVSDVARSKEFYGGQLGWRLDADFDDGKGFRVIQFTPPPDVRSSSAPISPPPHPAPRRVCT
jgi:Bleomycin resistance protein-like N-terminal